MNVTCALEALKKRGIQYKVNGDAEQTLAGFSSIYNYREATISWLRNTSVLSADGYQMPKCFACLVTGADAGAIDNAICQIWVENPKEAFFEIIDALWGEKFVPTISKNAEICDGAVIGEGTSIGPFTSISSQAVIGKNCQIGANVTIKGRVRIGNDCVIQSGAVIGEDGFAFIREENALKFVKHYGGVTIEDHVSIGSQACVCRGAIDDTVIKEYAKIDNLCHIAHNVVVGKRTIIVASTTVMGSVHIGDDCWIATSMIRDQRKVGNNVVVGMGAVVVKDIPDGLTVAGNPAKVFARKETI